MTYGRDDSLTRAALAWLLDQHPDRPVPAIDTQEPGPLSGIPGPWVCVDFSPGERFAIWKTTGAVHRVGAEGAVEDPAIHTPTEASMDDRKAQDIEIGGRALFERMKAGEIEELQGVEWASLPDTASDYMHPMACKAYYRAEAQPVVEALHRAHTGSPASPIPVSIEDERTITLTADELHDLESGRGCVVRDGVRVLFD